MRLRQELGASLLGFDLRVVLSSYDGPYTTIKPTALSLNSCFGRHPPSRRHVSGNVPGSDLDIVSVQGLIGVHKLCVELAL